MIPVQMNPMATQGLTEMYRHQRAMMEQARDIQQAAKTGQVESTQAAQGAGAVQGAGFGEVLNQFVGEVNQKQLDSTQAVNDLLAGKEVPLHQAMIAMQEAGVAFQLMVEVRNKLLEGYQELMRMQI
ncbi:MAG TPA: flagellar hook-basal body complex protein FliE [Verrucomicrobiales bacterium]|nr:flagellar hook-basal body complex protein FliE [Verrucomicrobiales bacterium]